MWRVDKPPFLLDFFSRKRHNPFVEIAFLLHLYQPSTQHESTVRGVAEECYLPLVKLLKTKKKFKLSLSIPLSLIEQMEKYGYSAWISDLKELIDAERVEIVGGAAYHPLLTKVSQNLAEKQIILNEYGLGYYFGRRTGFEGEKSIMIKNVDGFFPPELAVSTDVLKLVSDFDYKWIVADESAIPGEGARDGVYKVKDVNALVVVRNRELSNFISFKRDPDVLDILDLVKKSSVVVLDGEEFGHHYNEGIYLLGALIDELSERGCEIVTVSEYISSANEQKLDTILESSWGASDKDMENGDIYPLWYAEKNDLQMLQWELLDYVANLNMQKGEYKAVEDMENIAVWREDVLNGIEDIGLIQEIQKDLILCKATQSDQFWWASKKVLPTGQILDSPALVARAADLYLQLAQLIEDEKVRDFVNNKVEEIKAALAQVESLV